MTSLSLPSIRTDRLLLRPFRASDARRVQELAGEREIAATTTHVPHPYEDGMAEAWIGSHAERHARGESVVFAIEVAHSEATREGNATRKEEATEGGDLIGAIGLELDVENHRAEMGYWVGKPYWGRGFATEAARAVVRYGFEQLGLNRIHAGHFDGNRASGRVLEKIGMRKEGCRRQHVLKWGRYVNLMEYAILREELESAG